MTVILDLIQYPGGRLQENRSLLSAELSSCYPSSGFQVKPGMTEIGFAL